MPEIQVGEGGRLRVGLIGLGGVGRVHLEAYAGSEYVTVVAAAETDPVRLEILDAHPRVRGFTDFRDMLNSMALDAVCVLTPVASHASIVTECAGYGVHVLCEKPLALNVTEATAMIDACARAGVRLFYGASYRFLPALQKARAMIRAGDIGDVMIMREMLIGGRGPEGRHDMGVAHYPAGGPGGSGNGLVDHGIHLIDAFPWLAGSPVATIFGRGNLSAGPAAPEYLLMTLASGAVGLLMYEDGSYSTALPGDGVFAQGDGWTLDGYAPAGSWAGDPGAIHIHGSTGALRLHHYAHQLFHHSAAGIVQVPLEVPAPPYHFRSQIEAFAREIRRNVESELPGEAGRVALEHLLAVYQSCETGRRVHAHEFGLPECGVENAVPPKRRETLDV